MARSYSDLLKDPRWQRKRLEAMHAADFTCQACGSKDKTLNVHHTKYTRGRKPWEYSLAELSCLCEVCHERIHADAGLAKPKIYFAGKIEKNCWRGGIIPGLRNIPEGGDPEEQVRDALNPLYEVELDAFVYTGPFFIGCDHGCSHGANTHGVSPNGCFGINCEHGGGRGDDLDNHAAVFSCCRQRIQRSDAVFAWIHTSDCFGTIFELGQAAHADKPICVAFASEQLRNEMWFVAEGALFSSVQPSATTAWKTALPLLTEAIRQSLTTQEA